MTHPPDLQEMSWAPPCGRVAVYGVRVHLARVRHLAACGHGWEAAASGSEVHDASHQLVSGPYLPLLDQSLIVGPQTPGRVPVRDSRSLFQSCIVDYVSCGGCGGRDLMHDGQGLNVLCTIPESAWNWNPNNIVTCALSGYSPEEVGAGAWSLPHPSLQAVATRLSPIRSSYPVSALHAGAWWSDPDPAHQEW